MSSTPGGSPAQLIPTAGNAAVLFLDLQAEILPNARTISGARVVRSAGVLAKLAALHALPAFLSSVPPGGAFADEVLEPLGQPPLHPRTQTTAFADPALVRELGESGRRVLVLAGVASEVVVLRTALAALAGGFVVHVAVDACGGVDARTEEAAWRRIIAAGGVTSSVTTLAAELAGDFTTDTGGATLGLIYESIAAARV
ncbi:MAG: putative enzyme with cysteine hydrolase domain [Candidatus Eremiobacteraeota bacterium]|nr:putative enzyme with cysteine hydrolase domain [Candidatus Eremiobacteraeota bacterium]